MSYTILAYIPVISATRTYKRLLNDIVHLIVFLNMHSSSRQLLRQGRSAQAEPSQQRRRAKYLLPGSVQCHEENTTLTLALPRLAANVTWPCAGVLTCIPRIPKSSCGVDKYVMSSDSQQVIFLFLWSLFEYFFEPALAHGEEVALVVLPIDAHSN